MSGVLVAASDLAEPVWAGMLRWYLPFVIIFFLVYIPPMVMFHVYVGRLIECHGFDACVVWIVAPRELQALRYSLHSVVDVPLPVGLVHAYMTALETQMNVLVVRLSLQFLGVQQTTHGEVSVPR